MGHAPRNRELAGGISRYSRSAMYGRKALYKKKKVPVKSTKTSKPYYKLQPIKGEKNGDKRAVLLKKSPRYYPTEDDQRKRRTRKKPGQTRLRCSITPGTVLILLAGRHRGRRVVFLKQLASGLLLVTGPFSVNGVPLRRVAQAYVIATQTKVDIAGVDLPESLNDDYFRRSGGKSSAEGIFADAKTYYTPSEQRKDDQRAVDSQLVDKIRAVPSLRQYLSRRFSLNHGQYPHKMIF